MYSNKEEHIFKIGDIVSADSDYQVSIPANFYMTISELMYEDMEELSGELVRVYIKYNTERESSLGYDEIYVITKDIKITYEY